MGKLTFLENMILKTIFVDKYNGNDGETKIEDVVATCSWVQKTVLTMILPCSPSLQKINGTWKDITEQ